MNKEKKLLILSVHNGILTWDSLREKLNTIEDALNKGKDANFKVSVMYLDEVPVVSGGRVHHQWLQELAAPYFSKGYDIIGFHMSMAQARKWGIKTLLLGSNPRDSIQQEDFYFSSNENTKREGENRFVQTCLHEVCHAYYQETGLPDLTHTYHDNNPDIRGLVAMLDWSKYQPRRLKLRFKVGLLTKLRDLLVKLKHATRSSEWNGKSLRPKVKRAADKVVKEMLAYGHPVRIVEGFRSNERQNKLYEQGRSTPGNIVTYARGGESFHNYGVAVDFVFRRLGYDANPVYWELLGTVGKKHGFEWGGDWEDFQDLPHFQMTLNYTLKDFQEGKVDNNLYL